MCSKENVYVHKPVHLIGLKGTSRPIGVVSPAGPVSSEGRQKYIYAYPLKLSILVLNSTWTDLLCPVFYVLFLQIGAHCLLQSKEQNTVSLSLSLSHTHTTISYQVKDDKNNKWCRLKLFSCLIWIDFFPLILLLLLILSSSVLLCQAGLYSWKP